ncbi:cfem domain-containing protein [Teratosphaeria destructans]|uniref:Cfem domain-containing protein n=1 Tax=Teratosphaeria destructans TaxID=418781 RepID=A0A9W7ST02_9PEZI|nr:cfem domain-containing protein [Teratosphaeria destructans]
MLWSWSTLPLPLLLWLSLLLSIFGEALERDPGLRNVGPEIGQCEVWPQQLVSKCIYGTLLETDCMLDNTTCFCSSHGPVRDIRHCVAEDCSIHDVVAWEKYYASRCDLPVRDRSMMILAIQWTFFAFSSLAVTARLMARRTLGMGYGGDDAMITLAGILLVSSAVPQVIMVNNGLGRDVWYGPTTAENCQWICSLAYVPQVSAMKCSILLLYLRIFPTTASSKFRLICHQLLIAFGVANIAGVALSFGACRPWYLFWDSLYPHVSDKCIHVPAMLYSAISINMFTDLMVFILPLPKILKTRMSTKDKTVCCAMFCLGLVVTVAATVRFRWVLAYIYSTNVTYDRDAFDIFSTMEISLGVTFACIPPIGSLIRKAVIRLTAGSRRRLNHFLEHFKGGSTVSEPSTISHVTDGRGVGVINVGVVVDQKTVSKGAESSQATPQQHQLHTVVASPLQEPRPLDRVPTC